MNARQGNACERWLRVAGLLMSGLVIIACLAMVVGSWWLRSEVAGLMNTTEELARDGTKLVHAGINETDRQVKEARQEIARCEEKIRQSLAEVDGTAIATALLRRQLRENLELRIERMREQIAPLRDTLTVTSGFVDVLVSVESVRRRALWLDDVQQAFGQLEDLGVKTRELAESLKEEKVDEVPEDAEPVDAVRQGPGKIDSRLGEISDLTGILRDRVDTVESDALAFTSRVRWVATISAVAITLILGWLLYSQWVVIGRLRSQTGPP